MTVLPQALHALIADADFAQQLRQPGKHLGWEPLHGVQPLGGSKRTGCIGIEHDEEGKGNDQIGCFAEICFAARVGILQADAEMRLLLAEIPHEHTMHRFVENDVHNKGEQRRDHYRLVGFLPGTGMP